MWERSISWLPLISARPGDWTCNSGMCPDWKLNWQHFSLRDNTQPTKPHGSDPPWRLLKREMKASKPRSGMLLSSMNTRESREKVLVISSLVVKRKARSWKWLLKMEVCLLSWFSLLKICQFFKMGPRAQGRDKWFWYLGFYCCFVLFFNFG